MQLHATRYRWFGPSHLLTACYSSSGEPTPNADPRTG
jgi:hypothetical protein